jgi:non-ribosomal peptide synthetase component F/acyl carrier protein
MVEHSQASTVAEQSVPPGPHEEAILAIWRELLGRADIGIHDDFFEVGGYSLLALRVLARIRKTLDAHIPVMNFFESPTVAALAAAVANRPSVPSRVVTTRPPDADPVLSFDQQRLWLEYQLLPAAAYNVHGRRRLVGPIDMAALEAAIAAILVRHEALRTRFPLVDGQPMQVVDELDERWRIRLDDLGADEGDREREAFRRADVEASAAFDLAEGPLFRCLVLRLSDTEHILCVTMHHIISDAWSIGVFVRELSALYQAGGDPAKADLPPLPVQYRDFAVWQRGRLSGDALAGDVAYWRQHLDGAPPALSLPTSTQRGTPPGTGRRLTSRLSEEDTAALRELCSKHGVTSFMALLAGLATVLGRWSGQSDLVIGVPIAGRNDGGTENLIGFFVNTLPLRVDLSSPATFADLLAQVRQTALAGYAHADAPFDVVVKELDVVRDPRRTPLFQVMLNVIDSPEAERVTGVRVEPLDPPALPSKFDLMLTAQEADRTLRLQLDYDASRYQTAMMRVLAAHVGTLLRAVAEDPTRALVDYALQDGPPAPASEPPPAPAPHLAVRRWAAEDPAAVALVDAEFSWSYRRLDRTAGRIARHLIERGIGPAHHIGVLRRPGAAFVAAVLGARHVTASVTVLDPESPVAAHYLGVDTVVDVAPAGSSDTIDLAALIEPDVGNEPPPDGPPAPAPTDWAVERLGLGAGDRIALLSTLTAPVMSALTSAFTAGAGLAVADRVDGAPTALAGWLRESRATVVYLTPPLLRALAASAPALPALRHAVVDNGGDLLATDLDALRRLAPGARCTAVYRTGPDGRPLAVHTASGDTLPPSTTTRVPLGTELPGTPARLRHPAGQPAVTGEVAEVCFGEHHTGDLSRRWTDGTLEFTGRVESITGPDLLDTTATLRCIPGVHDAIVTELPGEDGRTVLAGYLLGPDPAEGTAAVRQHLLTRLPASLIPERLFILDRLPLTADGRYDLEALPGLDAGGAGLDDYIAPRTPMEHWLVEILRELLGLDRVGVHDSFFELGGFSLLATQLTTRIRELFGVELSLRDVFASPTVDGLAQLVVLAQGEGSSDMDLAALLSEIEQAGDH